MLVFGCKEKLNFFLKEGDKEIVKAIKWMDKKSIFTIEKFTIG
jgi:hypothetical protein|tara:strand:- start:3010 stop:3138 length:129 start_codon:yes stop_codon:yes gene_type:complete